MFGLLFYALGCLVVTGILMTLRTLVTKVSKTAENSNAQRIIVCWLAVTVLPYIWVEIQTTLYKTDFNSLVAEIAKKDLIAGEPAFFKVQNALGSHARLILVSEGKTNWGGTYRNLYLVKLDKDRAGWLVSSVDPVNTTDGDSAGFSLPPYW